MLRGEFRIKRTARLGRACENEGENRGTDEVPAELQLSFIAHSCSSGYDAKVSSDSRKSSVLFGHAVRELRSKQDISQLVLAEKADLSLTFISEIERGKRCASLDTILKLGRAFGITGAELLRRAGL